MVRLWWASLAKVRRSNNSITVGILRGSQPGGGGFVYLEERSRDSLPLLWTFVAGLEDLVALPGHLSWMLTVRLLGLSGRFRTGMGKYLSVAADIVTSSQKVWRVRTQESELECEFIICGGDAKCKVRETFKAEGYRRYTNQPEFHFLAFALKPFPTDPREHLESQMSLTNALPADAALAAKLASHILATLPAAARNHALTAIHDALSLAKDDIMAANARDLALAREAAEDGQLSLSIVSRLDLGKKGKWEDMLRGILDVCALEDPGMPSSFFNTYTLSCD